MRERTARMLLVLVLELCRTWPLVTPQHSPWVHPPTNRMAPHAPLASAAGVKCICTRRVKSGRCVKSMSVKNTKKSPIHENADANITCDFGDVTSTVLGVGCHIHTYIVSSIILRCICVSKSASIVTVAHTSFFSHVTLCL